MPAIVDDKSEHCIPFILGRLQAHCRQYESRGEKPPTFFVGINGVQGAGKTTLVSALHEALASPTYGLKTVVLSIDDLYLSHEQQASLAKAHPDNCLVQHRGEPSTHDVQLGKQIFQALSAQQQSLRIPSYDKSQYNGAGDRRAESEWTVVNLPGDEPAAVVVFEGWCVGFRALDDHIVERRWTSAKEEYTNAGASDYEGQLAKLKLEDLLFVNDALRGYDALTDYLGAFIHIDAEHPRYVYDWRQEQEAAMRATQGTGMTEAQVTKFVDGYYPAYELYTDVLRNGIFQDKGKQLRMVVGRDRRVKKVYNM